MAVCMGSALSKFHLSVGDGATHCTAYTRGGPIFRPLLPTSSSPKVTSDQGREGRVRAELARDLEDLVHWGREERRQGVKH